MIHTWLHNKSNKNLILFFSGWGLDEIPFSHIKANNYDVLFIYDYTEVEFNDEIQRIAKAYDNCYIIGWSMGVYIAQKWVDEHPHIGIDYSIAINGTCTPFHKTKGIHPLLFKKTGDRLSEKNINSFYEKIIGEENLTVFEKHRPNRSLENQKQEIYALLAACTKQLTPKFNKVFISKEDQIFTTQNQTNYWQDNYLELPLHHFVFYNWESWDELIEEAKSD